MKRRERQLLTWIMTIVMLVGTVLPADLSFAGDAGETADAAQPALNRKSEYAVFNSINELNGVKSDESYYNTGISGGNRGLNYTEDKAEATPVSLASTTSLSGNSLNLDPTTVDAADKRWSYIINGSNELVEIYEYYTDQPTGYPAPVGIISGLNPSQVSSVANLNVNHMLCGNFDYYLPDEYTSYMYDNYEKYDYTVVGDPNEEKPVIMTDHGVAYVSGDPSIVKGQMSLSKLGELFAEAGTIIDLYREQKQKYLSDKGVDDVTYDKLVEDGYWGSNIVKLVYDGTQVEEPYVVFCKDHQDRFKTGYLTHHTLTPISTAFMGDLYDPVTGNKVTSKPGNILVVTDTSGSPDPNLCDAAGHKYAQTTNAVGIANNAFQNNSVIQNLRLDGEFQYVGDAAFKSCTSLKTADFTGVKFIGNDVFNDCTALTSVTLDDGLKVIGNQAFFHCVELPEITMPPAVNTIGFGAFAECTKLASVRINSNDTCQIRDYAFFNDLNISGVSFSSGAAVSLGKAAFALGEASTLDKMMSFTFPTALTDIASSPSYTLYGADVDLFVNPAKITGAANASASINSVTDLTALKSACEYQSRMGDFLLANRQYLTEVNLKVLGSSTPERLPMNTFQGCLRLKDVVLDRAQNQLKLDANLFRSSTVNELTVNGPEYATANTGRQDGAGRYYARPRMSSWACFSAVADYVPYCYPENHFEVGYPIQDDSFLFDLSVEGSDTASIRSCTYMGNVDAAGLFGTTKDKPFSIPDVVAGYKVNALQDGCLDSVRDHIVYLQIPDDTLTTLNNRVFSEADELKGVDIGNSVTSIGEGCFMKCGKLEEVTIGEGIREIGTNCFADCPKLKHVFWDVPATPGSVMIAGNAFKTIPSGTPASQVNALYFHGYAEDASYGPLAYAMSGVTIDEKGTGICYMSPVNVNVNGFSTPVEESAIQTYSMIMDKKTNKITLIDYPHFGDLPAGIQQKFLNGQSLTDPERSLILESTIIQVPAAVQSIDVDSFLNNNINNLNWSYLSAEKQERYGKRTADAAAEDVVGGLFSAVTNETAAIQAGAGQKLGCELAGDESFSEASPDHAERGNDWITNVTLPRVEFIPEGAFDSCERLQKVNIGEKCSKVGTLAFRDCNELKTIETSYTTANPYFEFNNYILYEKLSADGKEINCCLPYRGREMGPETSIASDVDGDILNQVVSIHESAFAGCVRIRSVDLEETALTRVGAGCFDGCEKLNTVKLPESVTKIGDRAFTGCADGLMVNIPNMMTYITKDAFDPPSSGNVVYIRTPKDSTAYNITNIVVQDNRNINWVDMVAYMVRFFNDDRVTQIGETQLIETPGSNARIPDTADLVSTRNPDAAFDHWEWVNPATGEIVTGQKTVENVNEDRDIFAVYDSVTHTVTFNNDDGSLIAIRIVNHGEYVVPPSERNLTTKLHPGEEDQYEFSRWLVTINGVDSNFDPYSDPVTVDVVCTACFVKNGGSILAPEEDELRIYFVSSGTQSLETEYTGDAIKPSVAVMCKNTLLTQGVDYTVKYSNNVNVSQSGKPALAIINGKGNFSGSYKMEFRITPKKLSDINGNPAAGIQIAGMSLKEGAKPKPKLVYNGKNIAGKQYSFFWNPADDTVSFSAKSGGNFSGTIAPQPISRIKEADYRIRGIKVSLSVSEKIYNGRSQTLGADELLVTDASGLIPLVKNRDYFVNYIGDTVNAGTVKVRVCGMGDYHGDITKSYRIKSAGKAAVSVNLIPEKSGSVSYTYRKSGVRPAVKVTVQTDGYTRTLREGVDYKLSYSGNKRAGKKGCCKLKFIGNYKGVKTIKKEFEILQADLKDATVIVGDMKYTTPGKYRSKAVVLLNNELVAANEYKVIYLDENGSELNGKMRLTADKTISVNVLAKNKNYTGISTTVTYKISPGMTLQDISKAKLSLTSRGGKTVKSVGYTGDYVRFDPENPARQADLVMNIGRYYKYNGRDIYSNFEVIYVDNVNCGTATVILVPRDDSIHSGICVGKFKIRKNKMKK